MSSLPPVPAGSLLKSFELDESPPHKFALFESLLISLVTGGAIVLAIAILLFFET